MLQSVNKKLECRDLITFFKSHSKFTISKLYSYPAACLCVFRELSDLSKQYILRLLFLDQPVNLSVLTAWTNTQYNEECLETIKILKELYILIEVSNPGINNAFKLDDVFKTNLRSVIVGNDLNVVALPPDKYVKDISFLDSYAQERWECILHYMVRSRDQNSTISKDVVRILNESGLIKKDEKEDNLRLTNEPFITPLGFQFLLLDISSQVWYFILQYIDCIQGLDAVECMAFLFQLNFLTLGKDYPADNLTDSQSKFLQHLREFGLVYQRKRTSQRYFPTRLAINLMKKCSTLKLSSHNQRFIVVETNFRVYAYTASSLQLSLLAMFCKIFYRFPNMAVGSITRSSVRDAMSIGITAEQIVNFLQTHCHPEMTKQKPVLPPTIVDQIYLWELERDRFRFADSVLYSQFVSNAEFQLLKDYAQSLDVLVWHNPSRRTLVVTKSGHEDVRKFWKRHKQDN